MKRRLTKRAVDALKPHQEKRYYAWDADLPGFGVLVHPSGKRVYIARYRNAQGRERRITLGPHGALTPEQARTIAAEKLAAAHAGQDPAEERGTARRALTVRELAARYEAEHLPKKKPTSAREDRRILERYVAPALGHRMVADVTTGDLSKLHASMKGTPVMANRVLFLCSTLFSLAERWRLRPEHSNPARFVPRYPERKLERYLTDAQLVKLGEALAAAEQGRKISPNAAAAIRLLVLTGARKSEVLGLRWEWIDLENRRISLPDSKTGSKVIDLPAPAVQLLAQHPCKGEWVFPSRRRSGPMVDLRKPWAKLCDQAKLAGFRLHDLRHTHASVGAAIGLSLPVIGAMLGHSRPQTTARYAHLFDDPKRAAVERVGTRIAAALEGSLGADVIPMRRQ